MSLDALAAALAALPNLALEAQGEGQAILQPDGARLPLTDPSWRLLPAALGPGHGGGRLEGSGLEILDGWVLYPPVAKGGELAGLPPLVSTRDLRLLARQAAEARLTAPPDPARLRGLALGAEAVLAGARAAGLAGLEEAEALAAQIAADAPPALT